MSVVPDSPASEPWAETFVELYRAQRPVMVRLAHLLTAGDAAAEELVHDAFLAVPRRWGRIDNPAAYLRTAVVNACRSATWDAVDALVLVDANTVPPDGGFGPFIATVADRFAVVDALEIDVPVVVVTSDPDVATDDPRVGDDDTRRRFHANQLALADRLDAEVVVITGDPWPPTYRPAAVAAAILERISR